MLPPPVNARVVPASTLTAPSQNKTTYEKQRGIAMDGTFSEDCWCTIKRTWRQKKAINQTVEQISKKCTSVRGIRHGAHRSCKVKKCLRWFSFTWSARVCKPMELTRVCSTRVMSFLSTADLRRMTAGNNSTRSRGSSLSTPGCQGANL